MRWRLSLALALAASLFATTPSVAGVLDASWTAPTSNTDGSALTDLALYRVYYGTGASPCPGPTFFQVATSTSAPGPNQQVNFRLTGLATGTRYNVSVTAVDSGGIESTCSAPAGAVAQVAFAVTPATNVNFGNVTLGTSATQTFTIQNTRPGTVTGTASVSAPFSIVSGSPFTLVGNGATATVTVRFAPTTAAAASTNLILTADGDTQTRLLTGTGVSSTSTLTVSRAGAGTGTVTSSPAGISCGTTCSAAFTTGTAVTLTATPAAGSTFTGWSGACTGTGACTVPINAAASVTATFALQNFALAVTKAGAGAGTVTSAPAGIDCGTTCSSAFTNGTVVTLTATPAPGSTFTGWSGACSGTGPCAVTVNGATSVTANFALQSFALTVSKAGAGTGTVTSAPVGINCGTTCSWSYTNGSVVTLTATPAAGSTFTGWSGACSGTGPCAVTVNGATSVTANFALQSFALTVSKAGAGAGAITSAPAGINCGSTCSASFTNGTVVTLTGTPAAGTDFTGWSGACSGTGTCTVTMNAAASVTAAFTAQSFPLSVAKAGTGTGSVVSSPSGITCGATCSSSYTIGSVVTLTATPAAGASFTGWSGACSGTGTCTVTVNTASSVTANFALQSFALTVGKAGTGAGTVTSAPVGINCGTTCSWSYTNGSVVTLTATPAAGSTFTGWSGACTGTGSCTVPINAAASVTATFALQNFALTVSKAGAGTGTVTSAPSGINCGPSCSASFANGTVVTLTATPAPGNDFTGWSGACSGTGTCTVTMGSAASVTAAFTVQSFPLTVAKAGAGTGSVVSSPSGISCGATCSSSYTIGSVVTLTATPAAGSTFTGWSGACSGTGSCTVTVNAASSVTANFALQTFALTVSKAGTGTGTVASASGGINCGTSCSGSFASGTVVTLTAAPAVGSTFTGWSGACAGTGSCTVTMNAATSVTANFALQTFALTVSKAGAGTGTITSAPGGINCGTSCSASFTSGTIVTLTATPAAGTNFTGWSGSCTGTGTCTVTMNAASSVTATFTIQSFPFTVVKAGNGSGTVTSAPTGITCGAACSTSYTIGTVVTLTAAPTAGSMFVGWSGGCTGTGPCAVTMSGATSVNAMFALQPFTLTVTRVGTGMGTVSSSPTGIDCGTTCAALFNSGTLVTLAATPTAGSTFTGWGGSCSGIGTCTVSMTAAAAVTATFSSISSDGFTDNPLVAGTTVKAVHIIELRTAIAAVRARNGLPAFVWTDPTITARSITLKAIHITELRTALNQVYARLGRPAPTYQDPMIVAGQTTPKTAHIQELRSAVRALP